MKNNEYEFENLEDIVVKEKLFALSSQVSFNEKNIHSFQYINELHYYLFCDTKDADILKTRMQKEDIEQIDKILSRNKIACENGDEESILDNIDEIWEMQPFSDGNTRTLIGYVKILSKIYNLNINYKQENEINSGYISTYLKM